VFPGARRVDLPTYAFQRQRFWLESASAQPETSAVDAAFWDVVERGDVRALGIDGEQPLSAVLPALASWRRARQEPSAIDGWCYRLGWTPIPAVSGEPTLTGTWLVVVEPGADGTDVAAALRSAGADVEVVTSVELGAGPVAGVVSSLSVEPTSLADVILECQAMIEPQAQGRGIRMTFPQFDLPWFVAADRTRLKQVLINLLSNAVKYNQTGGTVVVDCVGSTADRTRINVRDTGAGLPAEKLAQLFQPFNRLGQERGAEQGTGIGLVMSKRLIDLMGGVLGVESTVGVGSVFWCELGTATAPALEATLDDPTPASGEQAPDAPLRTLLYVEDNPANLKLVEQLIARRPALRLLTAVESNQGIQLARAHQPDVILMDINLPGISGIEAMKILRDDPTTAHIPIVALSANAMPRDVAKGIEAGFFSYLTKPIRVAEFMEALDAALHSAHAHA